MSDIVSLDQETAIELGNVIADPRDFAKGILGHDHWSIPNQILHSVATRKRTAVKACHASSKALAIETPIATPKGWTTIGELAIGDYVFNENGEPVLVTQVSHITERESYCVTFDTGESIIACDEHLWNVIDLRHRPRCILDWREQWDYSVTLSTKELAEDIRINGQLRWRIPIANVLQTDEVWPLQTPAYTFGAWLGDGTTCRAEITCGDEDLAEMHVAIGGRIVRQENRAARIVFGTRTYLDCPGRETDGKRIPISVLRTSYSARLDVLRGLMDTDGWITRGAGVSICQVSLLLSEDIHALVLSLGFKPSWREQRAVLNKKDYGACYVVSFTPDLCPFRLTRKATRWNQSVIQRSRSTQRTIVSIEPVGLCKVCCIAVDSPRQLYLAGKSLVPTHNTFTAADAALWWVTRYKDAQVITTAPTWLQVEKLLWGNIKSAALDSKIKFPEALKTYLELGPNNYIIGISTDEGVRFQGWHGTILIILDEAPGVLPQIYEAIEGIRSGGKVHVLLLGNPTYPTGPFYDAFAANRSTWSTFTINAFDTPNFKHLYLEDKNLLNKDNEPYLVGVKREGAFNILDFSEEELEKFGSERPYLVQPSWVKEKYEEWGKDNPLWESKVLGAFPSGGDEMLIPLSLAESCHDFIDNVPDSTQLEAGIDVAGPGEAATTLYIRQAQNLIFRKSFPESDPRPRVLMELAAFRDRLKSVKIDSVGNGYYFALGIRDAGYPVIEVNVGEEAKDKKRFTNLKAELYWGLRNRFKQKNIGGIKEQKLISQLSSIKWGPHKTTGKITIESKEEMRDRGAKSPDEAEGLMLCYADVEMLRPKKKIKIQGSQSFLTY